MIALACDHRVMANEGAYMRFPEVDLDLAPTRAMTNLMIGRLGRSVTAELLLSGRRCAAQEALALGIVDRCVPSDQLLDAAVDLAQASAGKDPRTVSAIKRRLWGDIADAMQHAGDRHTPAR
jgi:enoyl-CoA hydratase/carnithine racemase